MGAGSAEGGPCPSRRVSRAAVQGPTEAALRSFNSWLTCQGDDKGMLTKLANVAAGEMKISGIDFPKPLLNARGNNQLVLFAGAGVSIPPPARLPTFKQLTDRERFLQPRPPGTGGIYIFGSGIRNRTVDLRLERAVCYRSPPWKGGVLTWLDDHGTETYSNSHGKPDEGRSCILCLDRVVCLNQLHSQRASASAN